MEKSYSFHSVIVPTNHALSLWNVFINEGCSKKARERRIILIFNFNCRLEKDKEQYVFQRVNVNCC